MKYHIWVFMLLAVAFTGCTDYGNNGDYGNTNTTDNTVWEKGGEAYYNNVVDLQTRAGEKYETWSKTMDSLEAIKKLQQFFLADTTVTSATIGDQGIAVQYSNGMRGGILIDPQNGLENGNLNFRPGQKTITDFSKPKSLVNNKKAILIFAVYRSLWIDLIDEIINIDNELLPKVGFSTISVYKNQEATVDRFTELSDYGLIDIDSHGFAWPTNKNIQKGYLQTGELANLITTLRYWKDVLKGDLAVIMESNTQLYFLSPQFLASHNDFSKDNVLFFAGFCYSNLGGWLQISNLLGGGGYFGFDWEVRADRQKEWIVDLITKLCDFRIRPPFTTGNWMKEPTPPKWYTNQNRGGVTVSIHYTGDQDLAFWQEPEVETLPVTDVTTTTAKCGGDVKSDGGIPITEKGVCWSTSENPTISNNNTMDGTGLGSFNSTIDNLTPSTQYWIRAYATNNSGTYYGNQQSFTTELGGDYDGTFDFDGRRYKFKNIGTQTWMIENLAYLPSVNTIDTYSEENPCYYVYSYSGSDPEAAKAVEEYKIYGVLYNLPAALTACPPGWHLPSDEEWTKLEEFLGLTFDPDEGIWRGVKAMIGEKLKSSSGWESGGNGNNSSGFGALPGGQYSPYWESTHYFGSKGTDTKFWTSKALYNEISWKLIAGMMRELWCCNTGVVYLAEKSGNGFSVRCVKD